MDASSSADNSIHAQNQADADAAAVRAIASNAAAVNFGDGCLNDEQMDDSMLARLSGRVCRAATADGFRTLHPDGVDVKPWSWVVGEDGLRMLLGGRRSVIERLRDLGFTDAWIRAKLDAGESFRLALFPAAQAVPATWDGIFTLVRANFPRAVAAKVERCEAALRATPFESIQARARAGFLRGASYFEINEAATGGTSADPRYIDTARLGACAGLNPSTSGLQSVALLPTRLLLTQRSSDRHLPPQFLSPCPSLSAPDRPSRGAEPAEVRARAKRVYHGARYHHFFLL